MAESDQLKNFKIQRRTIKAKLTRFDTFLSDVKENKKSIGELKIRLECLQQIYTEYDQVQNNIDHLIDEKDTAEIKANNDDRETFENNYFKIITEAHSILDQSMIDQQVNITNHNSNSSTQSRHLINLQPIKLPEFDGTYEKWVPFKDTFESLIHLDASMPDIVKFHHLQSCLKGKARLIIESLEVSSQNYLIAWELLQDRFENKTLIIHNHIKKLVTAQSLPKESSTDLRTLIDTFVTNLRSLKALGQKIEEWDQFLIYLLLSKLDSQSVREWENKNNKKQLPNYEELMNYLKEKCQMLEKLSTTRVDKTKSITKTFTVSQPICEYCKDPHKLFGCPGFLKLSPSERSYQVKRLKLCLNCLNGNHLAINCGSKSNCKVCKRRHNTLLHIYSNKSNSPESCVPDKSADSSNQASVSTTDQVTRTHFSTGTTEILLATVKLRVKDSRGNYKTCRGLLDSASQSNFMSQKFAKQLNLNTIESRTHIAGLGNTQSSSTHEVNISFQSINENYNSTATCKIVSSITEELPSIQFDANILKIPSNLQLADPSFCKPGSIDILLGASIFFSALSIGQIKLANETFLQKTLFGWVVVGPVDIEAGPTTRSFCALEDTHMRSQLERFWDQEKIDELDKVTLDHPCEIHFKKNTTRAPNGQFIVKFPFKENLNLGNSYEIAKHRLFATEKRLAKNSQLKTQYVNFMKEYHQLGHMTKLKHNNIVATSYYLPHHPVIREESLTTKVRVVFDGSCPSDNGISLNQMQLVGPTIQQDLFAILLRFRKYPIAITGDVEKMYRMVLIHESQRDLQRILWRQDPSDPIEIYQLNTVTYGTTSAPFLAIRCLTELANETDNSQLARIIKHDFYVDDLLTGAYTLDEAILIQKQLNQVLNKAQFHLRKWASNNKQFLGVVASDTASEHAIVRVHDGSETKTLGVVWCTGTDMFQYSLNSLGQDKNITKRTILSTIAQIYDPLGLLAPVIVKAKLIMQKLWQEGYSWDESVSHTLYTEWNKFIYELKMVTTINIPRYVLCHNLVRAELHGFCDSSMLAYGACFFVKCIDSNDKVKTNLLCAKTRVAPLHPITIPKLELCAALLLAELLEKVVHSLNMQFTKIILWSDSTIVLNWIHTPIHNLLPFVAHRVAKILKHTKIDQWHHVKSHENPADLLTRGVYASKLNELSLWWNGPTWLQTNKDNTIHITPFTPSNDISQLPEIKKSKIVLTAVNIQFPIIINNYSNLTRLQRVLAYVLRFINNIKCKTNKLSLTKGVLSVSELDNALNYLIRVVQSETFHDDIKLVTNGNSVSRNGKLLSLNPFLDTNKILRVGGRLKNSKLTYNERHPIILPNNHHFTKLIFEKYHMLYYHAGPQLLLSIVRNKYWPINGRSIAKQTVHRCLNCFKRSPKFHQPLLGNLPSERITPSIPFTNTGIDYAGPFLIKDKKTRGCKCIKSYICIFVCFVTKAIHIELVGDLTTESFLSALKRFCARRGKPHTIYSDNATNFVKANKDLANFLKLMDNSFLDKVHDLNIQWKFIPPRSPNFGGLWEASVKAVKRHLAHCNIQAMIYEDFITVLAQIEAILNSRPLSPLSSDPDDLTPLTPAHFLIGKVLITPADPIVEENITSLTRFKRIQDTVHRFWKRWSTEYLNHLQQRHRCQKDPNISIAIGDLVVLKEDNVPPLLWKMGRIIHLHPGNDNKIRVVSVKTNSGIVKRAISKLSVLPVN